MRKILTDQQADQYLFIAFCAFALSCVHPGLGLLLQLPLMCVIIWRCDVKTLPALMVVMLGKYSLRMFNGMAVVLRIGITLTPSNLFIMVVFIFAALKILQGRYDNGSKFLAFIWLPSIIPAFIISFMAKRNGISGIWADPILSCFAPSLYYWGMSMGDTYAEGRDYLLKRLTLVFFIVNILMLSLVLQIFTYTANILPICLAIYYSRSKEGFGIKALSYAGAGLAWLSLVFLRYMYLIDVGSERVEHSTFTSIVVVGLGVALAYSLCRKIPKAVARALPYWMVVANISLVAFVVSTQSGNDYVDAESVRDYQNTKERFTYKLFGDRAGVWKEGWNDCKSPPLVFKDMRQFVFYSSRGFTNKILPHNQFLTLVARYGWWLGLTLAIFVCAVQVRAFRKVDELSFDQAIYIVIVPVGAAIFAVVGTTGQAVATAALWSNSLACYVLPGVVYGYSEWLRKMKFQRRMLTI